MQPELPNAPTGSEKTSVETTKSLEQVPNLPMPEMGIETGAERVEQSAELHAAVADASSVAGTLPVQLPATPGQLDDGIIGATPLVAAHDDVIEKEWVDKAKKILAETKEDPYTREQQVSQLQKDYLKKRYGKELGASSV